MTRPLTFPQDRTALARAALAANVPAQQAALGGSEVLVRELPLLKREGAQLLQAVEVSILRGPGLNVALDCQGREWSSCQLRPGEDARLLLGPAVDHPTPARLVCGEAQAPVLLHPQRRWRLFLIHQSHLDIGYTDPQLVVLENQCAYLDAALELASRAADWPEPARWRWNVETTLPLQRWLHTRPRRQREAFLALARSGVIEVCALSCNMHTEAFSIDELARQLAFATELRDRFEIPVVTAMQTDVPGATFALPELLSGAGISNLAVANNYAGRSVPYRHCGQRLPRAFRWRGGGGRDVWVWRTDSMQGSAYMEGNMVGLATSYDEVLTTLPRYLGALQATAHPYQGAAGHWLGLPADVPNVAAPYPFDILYLRVQGEFADNAPPSLVPAEIARRWNDEWVYPQLRMATNHEFFDALREEAGDRLQVFEGDWTDWWADGIGSAAREVAMGREGQRSVAVGQALHTLADLLGDPDHDEWTDDVDRCYERLTLFDEHTWGAADPWRDDLEGRTSGRLQWQTKGSFALEAHDRALMLRDHGVRRLGAALHDDGGRAREPVLTVLNLSAREAGGVVSVFVPQEMGMEGGVEAVDLTTGEPAPCEVRSQPNQRFRARGWWLRLLARGVPPLGFKTWTLRPRAGGGTVESVSGPVERGRYRLRVDAASGTLTSLLDRDAERELVESGSPFGFNQYVYDRYATAPRVNHLSGRVGEEGGEWLLASRTVAGDGAVVRQERSSLADRLVVRLRAPGAERLETTYEVVEGGAALRIENRVWKLPVEEKESIYFAFPFAVLSPRLAWEVTGGVDRAGAPRVPGSASHMRAIRHWVALQGDDAGVGWATLDAPLIETGMLHLPYAPFPPTFEAQPADTATVFSWAANNLWDTNFPGHQGGEARFRYRVASGLGGSPWELGAEAAECAVRPLVGMLGTSGIDQGRLLELEGDVDLVTATPAPHGVALHLRAPGPDPAEVLVRSGSLHVRAARVGDVTGRARTDLRVKDGELTLRLQPGSYQALELEIEG